MSLAEQARFFVAQGEDFLNERAVVPFAALGLGSNGDRAGPELATERLILGVKHDRFLRRPVQGEAPGRRGVGAVAFFSSGVAGGGDGMKRQPAQTGFIGDDDLECVGGVEDVF